MRLIESLYKKRKAFLSYLLIVTLVLTIVPVPLTVSAETVTTMMIWPQAKTLYLNANNRSGSPSQYQFNVRNKPSGYKTTYTFRWEIEDSSIATVTTGGVVTAKKVGETIVRCKIYKKSTGNLYRTISADVAVGANAKTVTIDNAPENNIMEVGSTFDFNRTKLAENGGETTDITRWSIEAAEGVASIDEKTGLVTALKSGVFTVQAKTYQSTSYMDYPTAASEKVTITVPLTCGFNTQPVGETKVVAGYIDNSLTAISNVEDREVSLNWYECDNQGVITGESLGTGETFNIPNNLSKGKYYYLCKVDAGDLGNANSDIAKVIVGTESWDSVQKGRTIWTSNASASSYSLSLYKKGETDADDELINTKSTTENFMDCNESMSIKGEGEYYFKVDVLDSNSQSIEILGPSELYHNQLVHEHSYNENGVCTICGEFNLSFLTVNANNCYELDSRGDLMWFVAYVNAGHSDAKAILKSDVDMDGVAWKGIESYSGTFDGMGHTISNICKNASIDDGWRMGLTHRLLAGGVIKNLKINNADVFYNFSGGGGIVTGTNNGIIENVLVTDSCVQFGAYNWFGGIVGLNNGGTIRNCGIVNTTIMRRYGGAHNKSLGGIADINGGIIENCYAYNNSYCNGLVGSVGAIISNGNTPVNCYYFTNSTSVPDSFIGVNEKTDEQFKSGEVAYLLNSGKTDATKIWCQTCGEGFPEITGNTVYGGYSDCGQTEKVYSNSALSLTPIDHTYGTAVINEEDETHSRTCTHCNKTFTEEHVDEDCDYICDICGVAIARPDETKVQGHSLTLNGDIGVNFYATLEESILESSSAYVILSCEGKNTKIMVSDEVEKDVTLVTVDDVDYYCYKFTCNVVAKQMAKDITAKVYRDKEDNNPIDLGTYSVKDYMEVAQTLSNENLKNLVDKMLEYGACAQNYFNYDSENLAAELPDLSTVIIPDTYVSEKTENTTDKVQYYGSSLILESNTTLRIYYKIIDNSIDVTKITANKGNIIKKSDSLYYVEIKDIAAKDLDMAQDVIVYYDGTEQFNIKESAFSYAYRMVNKSTTSDSLKNLLKAMYQYGVASDLYFN